MTQTTENQQNNKKLIREQLETCQDPFALLVEVLDDNARLRRELVRIKDMYTYED
jgi:hypothetical protein